ncbi:MAG: MauE/DoxX family redox-associated membrane protein [Chthoniobacterales bacterium]
MRIALWLARAFLAATFFYSGVIKLGSSDNFAVTVYSFALVPSWFGEIFARGLPWAELIAAILLVLPRVHRQGALFVAVLCIIFLIAISWALYQGIILDCGCFGESVPSIEKMWLAVARDIFLFAVAIFALIGEASEKEIRG